GHLWRLAAGGTTPERLTTLPGRYLQPVWSADGNSIRVSHWDPALTWLATDEGWEVLRVPATGGKVERVQPDGPLAAINEDGGGRSYRVVGTKLVGTRPRPEESLPIVAEAHYRVVPAPNGKWVAVEQKLDVYLVALPAALPTTDSFAIDLGPKLERLVRLT